MKGCSYFQILFTTNNYVYLPPVFQSDNNKMNIFQNIIHFLNKPFPQKEDWIGASRNIISISIITTLFLYVFQPSGISDLEDNKFWICLGFGIVGTLSYYFYEFIFIQIIKFKKTPIHWTFGKWILYSIGFLFFISLGNFLYIRIFVFGYIQWNLFPYMIYGVFMFGVPIVAMICLMSLQQEKKYQLIAANINQQQTTTSKAPTLSLITDVSIFGIPTQQIQYIEALQNYVTIHFLNEQGQLQKQTQRATLKSILVDTEGSSIVKTHRSFLVNRQAIIDASGNSQGLLLTLSDTDKKIPVSRTYVADFKSTE